MALPEIMSAWTEGLPRRRSRAEKFGAALRGLEDRDAAGESIVGTERPRDPREERDLEIRRILLRRVPRAARVLVVDLLLVEEDGLAEPHRPAPAPCRP